MIALNERWLRSTGGVAHRPTQQGTEVAHDLPTMWMV